MKYDNEINNPFERKPRVQNAFRWPREKQEHEQMQNEAVLWIQQANTCKYDLGYEWFTFCNRLTKSNVLVEGGWVLVLVDWIQYLFVLFCNKMGVRGLETYMKVKKFYREIRILEEIKKLKK